MRMARMQGWTKKVVSKDDWEKKLAAVKVYKEDMNKLVMDFLVTEVVPHSKPQCNGYFLYWPLVSTLGDSDSGENRTAH